MWQIIIKNQIHSFGTMEDMDELIRECDNLELV